MFYGCTRHVHGDLLQLFLLCLCLDAQKANPCALVVCGSTCYKHCSLLAEFIYLVFDLHVVVLIFHVSQIFYGVHSVHLAPISFFTFFVLAGLKCFLAGCSSFVDVL